jgi:hypothetical protein
MNDMLTLALMEQQRVAREANHPSRWLLYDLQLAAGTGADRPRWRSWPMWAAPLRRRRASRLSGAAATR